MNLIGITLKLTMPIVLEKKLTLKLCNISLSNEHLEITIIQASFPLKAEDKVVTSNDCNRKLHNITKEQLMI